MPELTYYEKKLVEKLTKLVRYETNIFILHNIALVQATSDGWWWPTVPWSFGSPKFGPVSLYQ